jgi:beta-glucanase (GH16 family)
LYDLLPIILKKDIQIEMKKTLRMFLSVTAAFLLPLFISKACENSGMDPELQAYFSYSYLEGNIVQFVNQSIGDPYSAHWDFGNGNERTTNEPSEIFEVYYPEAADYEVSLSVFDGSGYSDSLTRTIRIESSDLLVAFTAVNDLTNTNYVDLSNTTEGDYDSLRWVLPDLEIANVDNYKAYFPKSGNYNIELRIFKNGATFLVTKTVTIIQDDPAYIEGMTLIWSDEFNEVSVDRDNWIYETGATGWGNNELQNYTRGANSKLMDGKLVITARKVNDETSVGSYTSSRMVTMGRQEFLYGRIEIRAKLPSGRGIWPALWMLGRNINSVGWPACGEMDIMEYVGYQPNFIHATVHTPSGFGANGNGSHKYLPTCEEDFHVYGLIWDEEALVFYTDIPENITHTYAPPSKTPQNWPFDQPHFFIMNIAVGGDWGGLEGIDNSIFPQTMEVDYVRVYKESDE